MAKSGVRSIGGQQFYYGEGTGGESLALGINSSTGDLTLAVKPTPNATTSDTALIAIESALNGNINLTPNGSGNVVISSAVVQGGTIDNTAIGATTPSTGDFTSLSINGVPVTPGGSSVGFAAIYAADQLNYCGLTPTNAAPDTVAFDTNSAYNTTFGQYTIPVSGIWTFSFAATISNITIGDSFYIGITNTTTNFRYGSNSVNPTVVKTAGGFVTVVVTGIFNAVATDVIQFDIVSTGEAAATQTLVANFSGVTQATYVCGALIG